MSTLNDGAGLDVVAAVREHTTSLPALVVLDDPGDVRGLRRAARLGARVAIPPLDHPDLSTFVREAVAAETTGDESVRAALLDYSSRHGLSPRELEIVRLAVIGRLGADIRAELRLGAEAYKSAIQRLLAKTPSERSLLEVANAVLRWAQFGTPLRTGSRDGETEQQTGAS